MINFASNLNKMIEAGLGGPLDPPRTEVAVGHRVVYTEASGAVVSFESSIIAPIKKLRVTMEPIQEGTGDPSPDNIRPITGRDSVTVTRTGANLWGGDRWYDSGIGTADLENRTISGVYTTSLPIIRFKMFKPNSAYTIILTMTSTATHGFAGYQFEYSDGTSILLKNTAINSTKRTYVWTSNASKTLTGIARASYSGTKTYWVDESGIFEGALTAADFVPYDGQSATIQLGQTVYGGMLDVSSGRCHSLWANIPAYAGEDLPGEWLSDRDVYEPGTVPTIGAQVVYKREAADMIILTPVQLSTLAGENNVWSDAGDVTLEYPYYEETEGY